MQTKALSNKSKIQEILRSGSQKIAPLWSLENFVAVNPYLGMSEMKFEDAMDFLSKTSDAQATLPIEFYLEALQAGKIKVEDISQSLKSNRLGLKEDPKLFINELYDISDHSSNEKIKTLADVASEINGKKWRRFVVDRISFWASAYFDDTHANWKTSSKDDSIFTAWKKEAEVDYSTEAMGLKGFRKLIQSLPENHIEAATVVFENLDIPEEMQNHYLNALLMKINGWAGYAARIDWEARLDGRESHALEQFLSILLCWELCLKELLDYPNLIKEWNRSKIDSIAIISSAKIEKQLSQQLILQKAFDIANQRIIIQKFNEQTPEKNIEKNVKAQAIFCIDVRSETFRRNLEAIDSKIETLGFAGFFGFPINYVPIGHKEGTNQCPVLLSPTHVVKESLGDSMKDKQAITRRNLIARLNKTWKAFKSGAISCFGFVSPLGLYFLPKLFSDLFGFTRPVADPNNSGISKQNIASKGVAIEPHSDLSGIPKEDQLQMALSALKAMSLTDNFAPMVLIIGHGSSTVNNPHANGLDCGACGGHSGEANAKVAATILNKKEIREQLKSHGINIPDSTLFIAGLHNTTTDEVTFFSQADHLTDQKRSEFFDLQKSFELAGQQCRIERGMRMMVAGENIHKQVIHRSNDWSQIRPELGLAGCSSFVVAPRTRTSQINFEGRTFLHSYDWKKDENFNILETIMTAPMVVTSWINLQYFASTVDNKRFGAGNKALHNVVGGIGVLEGFAGDLRVGLPWQSIHDGEQFQHEPNRLNVIIEAPIDAMSEILKKHESIRHLCDNEWIYLFALKENGKVAYKYMGQGEWKIVS